MYRGKKHTAAKVAAVIVLTAAGIGFQMGIGEAASPFVPIDKIDTSPRYGTPEYGCSPMKNERSVPYGADSPPLKGLGVTLGESLRRKGHTVAMWKQLAPADRQRLIKDVLNDIETRLHLRKQAGITNEILLHEQIVMANIGKKPLAELHGKFFEGSDPTIIANILTRVNDAAERYMSRTKNGFPAPSLEDVIFYQTAEEYHYQLSQQAFNI